MNDNNNINNKYITETTDNNMMCIEKDNVELNYKLLEKNVESLFDEELNMNIFRKEIYNNKTPDTDIPRSKSYEYLLSKETMWELDDMVESEEFDEFDNKENNPLLDEKSIIINKINESRINTTQKTNESGMFAHTDCYCCNNYLTIHNNNIGWYLSKYEITNKSKIPRSSNSIKKLFKLRPDIFKYINPDNYRFLKNFDKNNVVSPHSYEYKYEVWTIDNNDNKTIIECSICNKGLCSSHYDYNPYYIKKCSCCSKNWNICSWCLYDVFSNYIVSGYYFKDEKIFCELLHSK